MTTPILTAADLATLGAHELGGFSSAPVIPARRRVVDGGRALVWEGTLAPVYAGERVIYGRIGNSVSGAVVWGQWRCKGTTGGRVDLDMDNDPRSVGIGVSASSGSVLRRSVSASAVGMRWVRE